MGHTLTCKADGAVSTVWTTNWESGRAFKIGRAACRHGTLEH